MSERNCRWTIIAVAIALYATSLFLPAVTFITHVPPDHAIGHVVTYPGWYLAGFGWIGTLFLKPAAMGWLANITFIAAIFCHAESRYERSMVLSAISIAIAVFFFWLSLSHPMPVLFSGIDDVMNEPKALLGFYCWVVSFAFFLFGSWMTKRKRMTNRI